MTNVAATLNDLRHVAENGKAELVKGELVLMSPTGGLPGYAAGEIFASLREYAQRTRNGYAFADNVGFIVDLPERQSFSPDAAFYTGELTMKFLNGAPVFAVEVRSESDYGPTAEQEMEQKRADYFTAGTLVVWDVDLMGDDVVRSYNATNPDEPIAYRRGEQAAAEPAVPGWTLAVDRLFPD
ncbi:MAG: Uma2 family endonuclease [Gemmatimonadetes bacterium]|nr:Uma2 family endonuclease [Gemmatimonadota bacterium]